MCVSRSVIQVVDLDNGRPQDVMHSIFPSISCSCDLLCLIRCPRYCNFLVLNCRTISLPVAICLNTASLVILSLQDIFDTLQYMHISNASSLEHSDFVIVHVSARGLGPSIKEGLYKIQILCRRYPFWSYPARLTIADPPG